MIPPDVLFKPFTAFAEVKKRLAEEAQRATVMSPAISPARVIADASAISAVVRLVRSIIVGRKAI